MDFDLTQIPQAHATRIFHTALGYIPDDAMSVLRLGVHHSLGAINLGVSCLDAKRCPISLSDPTTRAKVQCSPLGKPLSLPEYIENNEIIENGSSRSPCRNGLGSLGGRSWVFLKRIWSRVHWGGTSFIYTGGRGIWGTIDTIYTSINCSLTRCSLFVACTSWVMHNIWDMLSPWRQIRTVELWNRMQATLDLRTAKSVIVPPDSAISYTCNCLNVIALGLLCKSNTEALISLGFCIWGGRVLRHSVDRLDVFCNPWDLRQHQNLTGVSIQCRPVVSDAVIAMSPTVALL
ncbi:hypothetical protein B0H17DRAFT_1284271 [Mycena rosella]|uniref:Uncharacterized protein n=1 Tax=Mycena rosella TaxID=1033263 RepID=A0AAD7BT52_MYCRO|nr:hypothetical protein B0H17DRAFT_1284271 [Mycena rosella]